MAQRLLDTRDEPGWIWDMRKLVGAVRAELVDVRFGEFSKLLAPDDYSASQAFARYHGKGGKDGIAYPSVRHPGREFIVAFWPDVIAKPVQARHFR